jgi:hypothetical protein
MAIPKSEKLQKEEQACELSFFNRHDEVVKSASIDPSKLPPIECLGEFVAMIPYYQTSSTIHLPGEGIKSDEALIVGVGDLVNNVKVGDTVKYSTKHATPIVMNDGPYKDLKVLLLNFRSLYCKIARK